MRIIYNTSFIVEHTCEDNWLIFMGEEYIPPIKNHTPIKDVIFTKVSIDQPEGKTYSLQLIFDTEEDLETFLNHHLPEIEEKLIGRYKNQYVCFSSTLREIE